MAKLEVQNWGRKMINAQLEASQKKLEALNAGSDPDPEDKEKLESYIALLEGELQRRNEREGIE